MCACTTLQSVLAGRMPLSKPEDVSPARLIRNMIGRSVAFCFMSCVSCVERAMPVCAGVYEIHAYSLSSLVHAMLP